MGCFPYLLYVWASKRPSYRRGPHGPTQPHETATLHRRVGRTAATPSNPRRLGRDRLSRRARPRADAGHDPPVRPAANAPWAHGLQPSPPSLGLTVHRRGLRSRPCQTPAARLCPPPGALQPRGAASSRGRRALAWASPLPRRGLGGLQARVHPRSRTPAASRTGHGSGAGCPWGAGADACPRAPGSS